MLECQEDRGQQLNAFNSVLLEHFGQVACAEHIRHAFDVVGHDPEADFGACPRSPAQAVAEAFGYTAEELT